MVPLFQLKKNESCTAILDLDTLSWSKLEQKGPFIDERRFFFLIADDNQENIFLLGGGIQSHDHLYFTKLSDPVLNVQRLDKNGWHILYGSNMKYYLQLAPPKVPLDFYWNNDWPTVDFSKMKPYSKSDTVLPT